MGKSKLLLGFLFFLILSGVVCAKNSCAEFKLSDSLCAMVEAGNVDLLKQEMSQCRSILLEQASEVALRTKFYFGAAQQTEAEELEAMLNRCESDFKSVEVSVGRLEAYMEWVPVSQWDQRFGRNGFYHQVMQLKRETQRLRAVYFYYKAWLGFCAGHSQQEQIEALHQSALLLEQCLLEQESRDALRIWELKVTLLQMQLDVKPLGRIETKIEALLARPLSDDQRWELRLIILEYTNIVSQSEVKAQVDKTQNWLASQEQVAGKQLTLGLYEGSFAQERLQHVGSMNKILDGQLAPLKRLADQTPPLRKKTEQIVASQIEPLFSKGQVKRNWDPFELLSLRRYYQEQDPVDLEAVLSVCEIFLATVSADDVGYPEMLYQKGLAHFQNSDKANACVAWERLAREYPNWTYSPQVSAAQAGAMAANLAYNLFVSDPVSHSLFAKKILGALVEGQQGIDYCYHYGLVLMAEADYRAAATMFQMTDQQDGNYPKAMVQLTRCYLKIFSLETQRDELIQAMIKLVATIDKAGNERDLFDVVLTLAGLYMNGTVEEHHAVIKLLDDYENYWKPLAKDDATSVTVIFVRSMAMLKSGQSQNALQELHPALQANPREEKLWNVGLGLLESCRNSFQDQHRRGQYDQLRTSLEQPLRVAALLYEQRGDMVPVETIRRNYLEPLVLWLLVSTSAEAEKTERLKIAREIVEVSISQEAIIPQLWLVRCQALLAFSQGDYKGSQLFWYQIRQSGSPYGDFLDRWMEARYYGLVCLYEQEGADAVKGLIAQVLEQYALVDSEWLERLRTFQKGL